MTGEKNYFEQLTPYFNSCVTFGDRARGRIKGIGKLISSGFPYLDDVLLGEGLIANLINIKQLCDQGLKVNFNKSECIISNKNQEVLMKRSRSTDNSNLWVFNVNFSKQK